MLEATSWGMSHPAHVPQTVQAAIASGSHGLLIRSLLCTKVELAVKRTVAYRASKCQLFGLVRPAICVQECMQRSVALFLGEVSWGFTHGGYVCRCSRRPHSPRSSVMTCAISSSSKGATLPAPTDLFPRPRADSSGKGVGIGPGRWSPRQPQSVVPGVWCHIYARAPRTRQRGGRRTAPLPTHHQ